MVLAMDGSDKSFVWAKRQIESLVCAGTETETYIFQNRRSLKGLLAGGFALRQKARDCAVDLVHVHYGAAQAVMAVLFARKPVVISYCGSDLLGNYDVSGKQTWSGTLSRALSQVGALGSRRCIAKTEELRAALWWPWVRAKCDVIPNGVDCRAFQPIPQSQARAALGWSHSDPVVLFMDRQGAWVKDPALAQAAYGEARKAVPALRLHIVENEPPDRMPLFYNAADALLLTSRHEGSNNTVKEALACNLPVVSTDCGDIRERLRDVRWCHVCARDPLDLGARLAEVVERREKSNGRAHMESLSLDRVAGRILACYWAALSGNLRVRP